MAMWRCPHCGTPQAETARCWVCRRSSTSCGTCRHFRASVAANMGYCGLDRRRRPISGDEIRACWESRPDPVEAPVEAITPALLRTPVPHRDFIEIGASAPAVGVVDGQARPVASAGTERDLPTPMITPRWSLWEDAEA